MLTWTMQAHTQFMVQSLSVLSVETGNAWYLMVNQVQLSLQFSFAHRYSPSGGKITLSLDPEQSIRLYPAP